MAKPKSSSLCLLCIDNDHLFDESDTVSWIKCDVCRQWLHTKCASILDSDIGKIASYHCDECQKEHGPSQMKRQLKRARVKIDYVALDQGEVFAVDKSAHPHVPSFTSFEPEIDRLQKQNYVDIIAPEELTKLFVLASGLTRPVLVPNVDDGDCGMVLPCSRDKISVAYITKKTGNDASVEVMDVLSQQSELPGWSLEQWNKYFYTDAKDRDRIRNVISLEVSNVPDLGDTFIRPEMVRQLDLVDKVWCVDEKRPKVTVYCLMSVAGSYTDFHIDFSGTPVYYTVCLGLKTFLMYPPTDDNLQLYTSWCQEQHQNFMWFGDYTKKKKKPMNGFKVNLHKGDLFIIPSGWIHLVYTPDDAVIIGGNYLTLCDIPMHIKIYNIEKETRVPARYRFPMFNKVMWLTSWYYMNHPGEVESDIGDTFLFKQERGTCERLKKESDTAEYSNQSFDDATSDCRQNVFAALLSHLREHYETSKTNALAKKSIPTSLIGRNVLDYLDKFETWIFAGCR